MDDGPGAGIGVIDAVGRPGTRSDAGHFTVAVTGAGIILGAVIGEAEEDFVARGEFGARAEGGDVLVVVFGAGVEVLSVAVARQAGKGAADTETVGQGVCEIRR